MLAHFIDFFFFLAHSVSKCYYIRELIEFNFICIVLLTMGIMGTGNAWWLEKHAVILLTCLVRSATLSLKSVFQTINLN